MMESTLLSDTDSTRVQKSLKEIKKRDKAVNRGIILLNKDYSSNKSAKNTYYSTNLSNVSNTLSIFELI